MFDVIPENCYKGYKQHSLSFLYLSVGSFFLFLYDLFIVAQILPGALIGIDGEQDRRKDKQHTNLQESICYMLTLKVLLTDINVSFIIWSYFGYCFNIYRYYINIINVW